MAIIATVAANDANSYGTLAEAVSYFASRPNSDKWHEAQSFDREQVLLKATVLLEQLDYIGDAFTATQALKWPRWYEETEELIRSYPTTIVPTPIKMAQFETALWLLETAGETVAAGTVDSMKIGSSVEIKYASGSTATVDTSVDWQGMPITAARFLKGLREIPVLA